MSFPEWSLRRGNKENNTGSNYVIKGLIYNSTYITIVHLVTFVHSINEKKVLCLKLRILNQGMSIVCQNGSAWPGLAAVRPV